MIHLKLLNRIFPLALCMVLQVLRLNADQTITGNLNVTGMTDVQGNIFTFGTRTDTSNAGLSMGYTDGTASTIEFDASRSANTWYWRQNAASASATQMSLDYASILSLYDSYGSAKIRLIPSGTSVFQNSIFSYGNDNRMPNQTVVDNTSILTVGLANTIFSAQFLSSHATTLSMTFSGVATGNGSVALGYYDTANGNYSFAAGNTSTASGICSTAMGQSSATNNDATALGNSSASGDHSTALGGSLASGTFATAMGDQSHATGFGATASGIGTQADAYGDTAIGRWNIGGFAIGGDTTWIPTDPLFEIGNGSSYYSRSDALVIYKNSNATFQGSITAAGFNSTGGATLGGAVTAPSVTTTGAINAGATITAANITTAGTVTATSVTVTQASGDIPMYSGN